VCDLAQRLRPTHLMPWPLGLCSPSPYGDMMHASFCPVPGLATGLLCCRYSSIAAFSSNPFRNYSMVRLSPRNFRCNLLAYHSATAYQVNQVTVLRFIFGPAQQRPGDDMRLNVATQTPFDSAPNIQKRKPFNHPSSANALGSVDTQASAGELSDDGQELNHWNDGADIMHQAASLDSISPPRKHWCQM